MEIRSLDQLDVDLAWRRVLWVARRRLDIPDRLPFEVLARTEAPISLKLEHVVQPVRLVAGTKRSGTTRPFVRLAARDVLLYQALVDMLAPAIESALGPPERILAYRQAGDDDNPYVGSPTWDDFVLGARERSSDSNYALRCDITSYFLYIDVQQLGVRLLSVGADPDAVADLMEFLGMLQMLGVRGLPQGVLTSSPLGNFYLAELDGAITNAGFEHLRYMDDIWVFADSFGAARSAQDMIERLLYENRLGLGGDKSLIMRGSTVLERTETAKESIEARKEALLEQFAVELGGGGYEPFVEIDPKELDAAAVRLAYEELWQQIEVGGTYPEHVRQRLTEVYRQLEALRDPLAVENVPEVLLRFPDLTATAVRYASMVASKDKGAVIECFLELLEEGRFHKEVEVLHLCRDALWFSKSGVDELGECFGELALSSPSPLVRARALLAWGRHSDSGDFSVADSFWDNAGSAWRLYALVAIQQKEPRGRDERFERWAGDGRFLARLGEAIKAKRFKWRQI